MSRKSSCERNWSKQFGRFKNLKSAQIKYNIYRHFSEFFTSRSLALSFKSVFVLKYRCFNLDPIVWHSGKLPTPNSFERIQPHWYLCLRMNTKYLTIGHRNTPYTTSAWSSCAVTLWNIAQSRKIKWRGVHSTLWKKNEYIARFLEKKYYILVDYFVFM